MRLFDRRAIELATNIIVMLIVGILIFVLSLGITFGVFCATQEISEDVSLQNERRVEQLLSGGGRVSVADNTKVAQMRGNILCGMSRERTADFVLGIGNDNPNTPQDFLFNVTRVQPPHEGHVQYVQSIQPQNEIFSIAAREFSTHSLLFVLPGDAVVDQQRIYRVTVFVQTDDLDGNPMQTPYGVQQLYITPR